MAGTAAMDEIFGRGTTRSSLDDDGDDDTANPDRDALQQTTSSVSVSEYFARRRAELGLGVAPVNSSGNRATGFTLEDQASFAEQQQALAYSGRQGLGLGRVSSTGNDTTLPTTCSPPPQPIAQKSAQFAPPPQSLPTNFGTEHRASESSDSKSTRKAEIKAQRKAEKKAERKAQRKAERQAERKKQKKAERKAQLKADVVGHDLNASRKTKKRDRHKDVEGSPANRASKKRKANHEL